MKETSGRKWVNKTKNEMNNVNKQLGIPERSKLAVQLKFNVVPPFSLRLKAFRIEWRIGDKPFCVKFVSLKHC